METNETSNTTSDTIDFNLAMCDSGIQKYIYITICLTTFSVVCNMTLFVFNFLHKYRKGKAGVEIVSCYAACQIFYSLLNTMVMLMNQLGHCGWIRQVDAVCKIMWWWKNLAYFSGNYVLLFITLFARSVFLSEKPRLFKKIHVSLGFWGILFVSGCLVTHYLIVTKSVDVQIQSEHDIIIASFCQVDNRYTKFLESIEFFIGSIVPCVLEFVFFVPLLISSFSGRELKITKSDVEAGSNTANITGSRCNAGTLQTVNIERVTQNATNKDASPNMTATSSSPNFTMKVASPNFTICIFVAILLNIFLIVPQRVIEYIISMNSKPVLLVIGLKNYSYLADDTWKNITVAFTILPLVYNIVMIPFYRSLILKDKGFFQTYLCSMCMQKKQKGRPLRRQKPIRQHVPNPSRCESVESDDRWTDE